MNRGSFPLALASVFGAIALAAAPSEQVLDANWWLRSAAGLAGDGVALSTGGIVTNGWLPAVVPGTLLTTYLANGRFPDPYYGLNNRRETGLIPDITVPGTVFASPHWYRTRFSLRPEFRGRTVWLELKGINWRADVWLNGARVGTMAGMFRRGLFDVTAHVVAGDNTLAVQIHPPDDLGQAGDQQTIARTPATMLQTCGWDFTFPDGVRDRNLGIHRSVRVFASGPVIVRDPFMATVGVPDRTAELELRAFLVNASDREQAGTLRAAFAGARVSEPVTLVAGETREVTLTSKTHSELVVNRPRIWWPVGRGKPELYDLQVAFVGTGGVTSHVACTTFGVRSIVTDTSFNNQMTFHVNGQRLFVSGGNWLPDAMLRDTERRYEAQVRYVAQAGVNLLRCWSGGGVEDDAFFDACDRHGILVWVESGLSGPVVLPDDAAKALHVENWRDVIHRVRRHPCVAHYCASNEGPDVPGMREAAAAADGTRGYTANSQDQGERGNPYRYLGANGMYDHTISDIWGAGPQGPLAGFNTESGVACLPSIDSLREHVPEAALWPPDAEVFRYQDGGGFYRIMAFVEEGCSQYGDFDVPDRAGRVGAENYAYKGQVLGAMLFRGLAEVWKRNKWDFAERKSGGYALWTVNSTQPQVIGRLYDHSLEPNAALYYLAHANQPLHAQYDYWKNDVAIVNDLPESTGPLDVRAEVRNLDGRVVWKGAASAGLGPDSTAIGLLHVPAKDAAGFDDVHFVCVELRGIDGLRLDSHVYWRSRRDPGYGADGPFTALGTMPGARLVVKTVEKRADGRREWTVTLDNPTAPLAFFLHLTVRGAPAGRLVRPCHYSDNYFSILPGDSRTVRIDFAESDVKGEEPILAIEGWNIAACKVVVPGSAETPDLPPSQPAKPRVNLALARPVTVSTSDDKAGKPAMAVDGDPATRWSSEHHDAQWILVDLGSIRAIRRLVLRWDPAYARNYAVQCADSAGGPWVTVREVRAADGGIDYLPGLDASGRYLRLDLKTRGSPWGFSLWELEAYE